MEIILKVEVLSAFLAIHLKIQILLSLASEIENSREKSISDIFQCRFPSNSMSYVHNFPAGQKKIKLREFTAFGGYSKSSLMIKKLYEQSSLSRQSSVFLN